MADETKPVCDDLAAKLEKHVALSVNYVVSKLARDEMPDDLAQLAVALASGETAQSLVEKVKGKLERRAATAEKMAATATPAPVVAPTPAEPAKVEADEPEGDGYDEMHLEDLRHAATAKHIEGRSGMDKAALIKALRAADKKAAK